MYKVILADDEPLILAGLRHKIDWSALGFEIVGECADGKELLDCVAAMNPDLLVIDIQMPHMTGLQVLNSIQYVFPVPAIVISGFSEFAFVQEALHYKVIDYLLKPVSSSMLQEAVVKAKKQLDLSSIRGRQNASLMLQFLRANIDSIPNLVLLRQLGLSGTKKYYWIVAFHHGCTMLHHVEQEIVMLRNDEDTMIAVIHSDILPENHESFLNKYFSFDGSAGISKPFQHLSQLPKAADEALEALETCWFKQGIFLWSTENEEQSIKFYLSQLDKNKFDSAEISNLLSMLPNYLIEHRLTVRSVESIYNTIIAQAEDDFQSSPLHYQTWKEIKDKYKNADYMLADLHQRLVPSLEVDNAISSSRAVVFKIKTMLQKDYAQPLTLKNMAARFHIDNSYLSTLFREETGKTFTAYLTDIRLQHACEYLRTTSLSNGKIAQLCGFTSDTYLKRVFRKVLGITPSVYREQAMRNSTENSFKQNRQEE